MQFSTIFWVQYSTTRLLEKSPKIVQEFVKKADSDLPFFHWTGINERFQIGPMVSFNTPSAEGVERLDRVAISCRAVPGVFLANRATLPQRGSLTVSSVSLGTRRVATTGFIRLEIIHHHTPSSYTNELLVFYGQSWQYCFRLCYSF